MTPVQLLVSSEITVTIPVVPTSISPSITPPSNTAAPADEVIPRTNIKIKNFFLIVLPPK
jgi:hypothetical protein